jgi:hypothetical protein
MERPIRTATGMERNRENMDQQASFSDWLADQPVDDPNLHTPWKREGSMSIARRAHAKGYKDGFDAALDLIGDPDQNRDEQSRVRKEAADQNRDRYGADDFYRHRHGAETT